MSRVVAHPAITEEVKLQLRRFHAQADPVTLLAEIRAAQAELGERVDSRGTNPAQPITVDLGRFAASLKTAWQDGERRPTHRRPYRRRKPVPKRPSMLDDVHDQILAWLDREPTISATAILERLKAVTPERFTDNHLRTIQRAVKVWRIQQARRIILESSTVIASAARLTQPAKLVVPPTLGALPRTSPTGVHSDPPRIAPSDSWRSLRDARVPSVDSVDDATPLPAVGNIVE